MKIRTELRFGFVLMALIVAAALAMVFSVDRMTNGHYGLLMLSWWWWPSCWAFRRPLP